jgi:hydrogenase 3 maturation protease
VQNPELETILKQKLENAQRVAVLGVGSDLRADDVAGILAAEKIEKTASKKTPPPELQVFIGATAPENLTGEIKKFNPSHLIIIDSADLNDKPGQIAVLDPKHIGNPSFCSHSLPLEVMTDYLLQSLNFKVIIIGIQPKSLVVGKSTSKEVIASTKLLAKVITQTLYNPD